VVAAGGGVFTVSTKDDASQSDLERAIRRGIYAAAALAAALAVIWVQVLNPKPQILIPKP
jgi:inorganic pyrophosphatase